MKSTKNLLMTGVALAIGLFASVQVNAIELTLEQKKHLNRLIEDSHESMKRSDKMMLLALKTGNERLANEFLDKVNKERLRKNAFQNLLDNHTMYSLEQYNLELKDILYNK